jgi:hypothetical protein
MQILGVTDRTLLRWKGKKLHPWPDPDDPSGRRLLYDKSEVDNLARRRQRRGSGSYVIEDDEPVARVAPPPPPLPRSLEPTPESRPISQRRQEIDDARRRWELELDARRERGESDFSEREPSSRKGR